jgi:hypothetical protein
MAEDCSHIPENGILHNQCREDLKSYTTINGLMLFINKIVVYSENHMSNVSQGNKK